MSNEVLENLQDLPEGGALLYAGNRYLLLPPDCLVDLQKAMEADMDPDRVAQVIFRSAHRQGSLLTAYFQQELSLGDEELMRFMAHLSRQFGWGRIEITSLGLGHCNLEMDLYHSALAEEYRQAQYPVCHLLRGFYAGVWQTIVRTEVTGLETRCRAADGPGPCTFVFAAAAGGSHLNVSISTPGEP